DGFHLLDVRPIVANCYRFILAQWHNDKRARASEPQGFGGRCPIEIARISANDRHARSMTAIRSDVLRIAALALLILGTGTGALHAADPQPYTIDIAPSGSGEIDDTLKASAQLVTLREKV